MSVKLPVLVITLLVAVAVGLLAGLWVDEESPSVESRDEPAKTESKTASAPPESIVHEDGAQAMRIEALESRLQQEIDSRLELAGRLEEMERRLADLTVANETAEMVAESETETPDLRGAAGDRAWFDEAALLDSGMDAAMANELKVFFEQLELERLYLRDRSAREDWDRGRLGDELRLLDDREESLKEQLGDDAYDAYLYASGQPNRVAVTSVLASAQAAQAGIEPGDLILRYDNERIYSWRDLRSATTSGNLTDSVEIEVERDGESLQFYLSRGPLGIRMDSRSVAP